jgi:hypothetical protein
MLGLGLQSVLSVGVDGLRQGGDDGLRIYLRKDDGMVLVDGF